MLDFTILDTIHSSKDIRKLNIDQLKVLADEIREYLIDTISKNGGHLASSLGVVEMTLALHKVFNFPTDKLLWDVGHQAYTHKIVTGRKEEFRTIRREGGLSGFPKSRESEYDAFVAGHSSNSISAALGIAHGSYLAGEKNSTIAVIGDGALSGGLAYEGLNNAGRFKGGFVVILNDNEMSISKNVGGMAKYLAVVRSTPGYFRAKDLIDRGVSRVPVVGPPLRDWLRRSKSSVKRAIYPSTFFEEMGFDYFGPLDGHDFTQLLAVFERVKTLGRPCFIHIKTIKGKGYAFAEENPGAYHGVSKFDVDCGCTQEGPQNNFSEVFGKKLVNLAVKDEKICAVTAAMKYGTGLQYFSGRMRERFFDVGIAEEHAVTFCGGLAAAGMKPVFAVYSTFLQRSYDQVLHDCALENRHVVLAIDRAGIVGEDGETHQGLFDVSFLSSIPHTTIYSPANYAETEFYLEKALSKTEGIVALRYPRGQEHAVFKNREYDCFENFRLFSSGKKADTLLVTYGRISSACIEAAGHLTAQGKHCDLLRLVQVRPLDDEVVRIARQYRRIYFVEEGIKRGSVAEHLAAALLETGFDGEYTIRAVEDTFVQHAAVDRALAHCGLTASSIEEMIAKKQAGGGSVLCG